MGKNYLLILFCLIAIPAFSQSNNDYFIDVSKANIPIITNHLKLGTHINSKGETLDANSLYFIKNGKPWYPVMGEFHFSRYPREFWEESILKMKGAGIDVIATYVFWIYHEEEEGKWNWEDNRDLKYFASLCKKHNVFLFIRIGPWCHGEVRNGGFPDWLLTKCKTRTDDSVYLKHVAELFGQIGQQLNGFYFKNDGPIIGAQMENEFRFNNPKGLAHILNIKKIAIQSGIDVPYYTATGWPGSDIKQTQLIPVWGAYPEAPWDKRITQLPLSENYKFETLRSDPNIGNDLLGTIKDTTNYTGYRYPYATAEMGSGIQITYHRRPIIEPIDVMGLAYTKIGSGANLMGYYMFHGGSNSIGKLSTLQESKATKYPNDYPIISYDFQSPISEYGALQPSYNSFKMLHYFLNDFGEQLVTYYPFFPAEKIKAKDSIHLRYSVRSNGKSGFVFINQFQRQLKMDSVRDVQFNLKLNDGSTLQFPQQKITIPANTQCILPFNMDLSGVNLVYATAQPVCVLNNIGPAYVFSEIKELKSEFVFSSENILSIKAMKGKVVKSENKYVVSMIADSSSLLKIELKNHKKVELFLITNNTKKQIWKRRENKKESLIASNTNIIINKTTIEALSRDDKSGYFIGAFPELITLSHTDKLTVNNKGEYIDYDNEHIGQVKLKWKEDLTLFQPPSNTDTAKASSYPLYGTELKKIPGAKYYTIKIPADSFKTASKLFLRIDYEGDTQAAYVDGKLIADNFYNGAPMMIGLHNFRNKLAGKEITLLITPLTDVNKIYLEKNILQYLPIKVEPNIFRITLTPQYQTTFSIK